jgi:hypothetical protein
MNPMTIVRTALFVLLIAMVAAVADNTPTYQQGTITKNFSSASKFYELNGNVTSYRINDCGDFQTGQVVNYRVDDTKIYIRQENGKDKKCVMEAKWGISADSAAVGTPPKPKYQQGTIMGYGIRRDTHIGGGGGGGSTNVPSSPVTTMTRKAKVYELKGTDFVYQVDYCGAFQAGKFTVGQVVDYRVDGDRLYIRHDNDKEYSCQLEGAWAVEGAKPGAPSTAPAAPAQQAATPPPPTHN